ncbi:hypothetical protein [Rubrivirga litoralis]|uniref:Tellurite resistance protein TerB n=1 Tax=Rubrivirga litoralis TaxID=3075598 RepID=A0ABU3BNW3_9BACT|nr:hypothetical protein [Rubrivirga sp. F394]MDT0630982.1 hypothetical protein [Rubrivirga sp. F394]
MVQQDVILRQVQQLAQALALALFHKRAEQPEQAQEALAAGLAGALGLELEALCRLPREDVLARCLPDGARSDESALAVADVLRETDSAAGWRRALWLYEAVLSSGGAVPFDVHERIEALRARLP